MAEKMYINRFTGEKCTFEQAVYESDWDEYYFSETYMLNDESAKPAKIFINLDTGAFGSAEEIGISKEDFDMYEVLPIDNYAPEIIDLECYVVKNKYSVGFLVKVFDKKICGSKWIYYFDDKAYSDFSKETDINKVLEILNNVRSYSNSDYHKFKLEYIHKLKIKIGVPHNPEVTKAQLKEVVESYTLLKKLCLYGKL